MVTIITPDQSRQARREFGLSQADVAEATGLKRPYLSEFESDTAQRFTISQLRKLRTFYEGRLTEAREAGEEIDLIFGSEDTAPETIAPAIETVKAKRFHFPVDDAVSDDTLASVLATIRANDRKLAELLTQEVVRDDGIFGSGDFTEETLQALRDSLSLLACNYLMVRAVSGWPEIGLSASNDNIAGNQVLSAILDSMRDTFEAAGLIGTEGEAGKREGGE
jgi:transcriptional regulator with XRE-family HTH domain